MKPKLVFPLIIIGGLVCAFTGLLNFMPVWLVSIIGGFGLGFGSIVYTAVYGGVVWGMKIPAPASAVWKNLIGVVGLLLGGYSIVSMIIFILAALGSGRFIELAISFVLWIVCLAVGPFIGKIFLEKTLAKDNNAKCLEALPMFKEIEPQLQSMEYFVVSFEGIAFFTSTNYCCKVFWYKDYELGDLSVPQEVALVGTYFVQKYSDRYTYKVDYEVIPGEPGQTVVAVGTGGIRIARIQGTPDKRLFRSYIFTKK